MSLASLSFSPARQHHLRIHKLVCVGDVRTNGLGQKSNTAMSTLFRASIVVTPIGGDYAVLLFTTVRLTFFHTIRQLFGTDGARHFGSIDVDR